MRRKNLFALVAPLLLLIVSVSARAQSVLDEHKFEVGAQYTAIGLEDFDVVNGVGGRVGYNFNKYVALDAEANFFPETRLGNNQQGQKAQGFVGIKAGARSKYAGLFGKVRPGVMSIGEITSGFDCNRTSFGSTCGVNHGQFALDAGAVAEFYPSRRSIIRLDVGDTMVNIRRASRGFFDRTAQTSNDFTHNLQISLGFSYRF
ncbi:MAG TPA: outer membrane beta-barrel protein [Pyrinomonadaceae bacterium]|nr:outer membrane beta-barrel protein [Pyrinomonadaceae bacterium]